ncbi:MAG: hypothetical protein GTN36_04345 [Candidatus Aenigmarchaeota archaeon]|nr:hypothetical protein [Candidatus Aenigmarchaeota archaeon]
MKCERCGKVEGEYLCSVCKRVVCSDCKVVDKGKVFCADHAPKTIAPTKTPAPIQPPQSKKEPTIFKILRELIYTFLILLIGIIIIFAISNYFISDLLSSIAETVSDILPELEFVFLFLTYFESAGLYAIITLVIIVVLLIMVYKLKKRSYKNI